MFPFITGALRAIPYVVSAAGALPGLLGYAAKRGIQAAPGALKAAPGVAKEGLKKAGSYAKAHPYKTAGAIGAGYVGADALGRMFGGADAQMAAQQAAIQRFKELAARQSMGTGFPILGGYSPAMQGGGALPALSAPLPAINQMPSAAAINDAAFTQLSTAGALGNSLANSMIEHYNQIKERNLAGQTYSIAPGFYQAVGSLGGALQRSAQALPQVAQAEINRIKTPVELANQRMQARASLINADANTLNSRGNYMYRTALARTLPVTAYGTVANSQAALLGALGNMPPNSPLQEPVLGALGLGWDVFDNTVGSALGPNY